MITKAQLVVPAYLNLSWLTSRYIRLNAWNPVSHMVFDNKPEFFEHPEWGIIPCKSRTEYLAGDIIIFDEFNEWEEDREVCSDRFYRVEQRHIDDLFSGDYLNTERRTKREVMEAIAMRTSLLPVGVVVHPPK